jgi:hypothetical protein
VVVEVTVREPFQAAEAKLSQRERLSDRIRREQDRRAEQYGGA